jgi:hypothetical protein
MPPNSRLAFRRANVHSQLAKVGPLPRQSMYSRLVQARARPASVAGSEVSGIGSGLWELDVELSAEGRDTGCAECPVW